MRLLFAILLLPATAWAQDKPDAPAPDVPSVATEIVIEDLTLTVKRLRIGVALSPDQIEGITKAIEGAGAKDEESSRSAEGSE